MENRWSRPSLHSHAPVDAVAIIVLILAPYVFGFANVTSARNLFWTLAGCTAIYTLITNFRGGLLRILPFGLHRIFDLIVAYWVMIGPVALGYRSSISGWQYAVHLIIGAVWIFAALFTRSTSLAQVASRPGIPEHVTPPDWGPWVGATGVAAILLAGWVIWSSGVPFHASLPNQAGTAPPHPDNKVAQGLKPAAIPGLVTPYEQGVNPSDASKVIEVGSDPGHPAFKPDRIEAEAGSTVCVHFKNSSTVEHYDNFMIVFPGREKHVAHEAMKVGPKGGYIPILPDEIIANTPTVAPGETGTTCFRVPDKAGEYPFISSARLRYTAMKGTLDVKKPG